ncbi:hypothetical protein [uncultured Sphingomonas sp.]|uniref:hypothetical protein n=1 Tax=uncultured Sphingomonas sp. TaxID=158754 RepID=UPI0025F88092|nr:hypothetical protein [uncultured Sphingomonas sp.]
MSDEPLAPEPVRTLSPRRNRMIPVGLGFLAGVALTAGAIELAGPHLKSTANDPNQPAAAASPSVQPLKVPPPVLAPATDVATLDARESQLAARLDALELELRQADESARNAAQYSTQAERLMVAAAVRRAIERGQPLGSLEQQLRARFGERHPQAVAAIATAAHDPLTIEDLRIALDTIAPRLGAAPDDSLWVRFRSFVGDLFVLHQAGMPSPRPAERLRRARSALAAGNVETAIAEVMHMPGASIAEGWTSAASRYVNARKALDEIEKAAAATPPKPPVVAPAPAPAPAPETPRND